jgi:asparaginyl-tRNA synthetase
MQIKEILSLSPSNQTITVKGWVRTKRVSSNVAFVALNDGSTIHNIQGVIADGTVSEETLRQVTTGACIALTGILIPSQGQGQSVEIQVTDILIYGVADPEKYPLQPKKHSLEFLREIAHLRPRTNTFSAILRVRHALAFAVHSYFNDKGFFYLHTPIITGSDAEGAGEMFRVTTLPTTNPPMTEDGKVDFKEDFFGKETNLTVSGQLEGELGAMALSKVYTFGPTFRAENSNTTRHLAEFWMIEPEVAFNELVDNMDLAEDFTKYCIKYALDHCADDIAFLEKRLLEEEKTKKKEEQSELSLTEKLRFVTENDFERLTYTEAINILLQSKTHKQGKFQYPVEWGIDLQSEHERWLVEKHFKKPVILTNYPKDIKAFYMKLNDDEKTVACMDVLAPGIGEIIGGSQREDDYETLKTRITDFGLKTEDYDWYLDLRKYGSVPHGGFGFGLERIVTWICGLDHVRESIPFPRTIYRLKP